MSSIWEYEKRVVAQHDDEKPFAPENGEPLKFGVGDIVAFTNENGVLFRGLRVTGFYKPEPPCSLYATGRRYLLDWSSPWFPAKESSLQFDSEVVEALDGETAVPASSVEAADDSNTLVLDKPKNASRPRL